MERVGRAWSERGGHRGLAAWEMGAEIGIEALGQRYGGL